MAAGLGFKTFNTGEVLTSADVNGYLMQGVLVFASEAARDAAITSPQEGQFAYTKDNNSLWYYTGSAWAASGATGDIEGVTAGTGISGGGTSGTVTITNSMATEITAKADLIVGTGNATFDNLPVGTNGHVLTADSTVSPTGLKWAAPAAGGKVLQVITANTSSETTIANTSYQDSGITASITPSAATSKVLILITGAVNLNRGGTGSNDNEQGAGMKLLRDSTTIVDNASLSYLTLRNQDNAITSTFAFSINFLDSPNTTSATTYKLQGAAQTTNQSGSISFQYQSRDSQIILMEIGA
jgi:hypothetical protein